MSKQHFMESLTLVTFPGSKVGAMLKFGPCPLGQTDRQPPSQTVLRQLLHTHIFSCELKSKLCPALLQHDVQLYCNNCFDSVCCTFRFCIKSASLSVKETVAHGILSKTLTEFGVDTGSFWSMLLGWTMPCHAMLLHIKCVHTLRVLNKTFTISEEFPNKRN